MTKDDTNPLQRLDGLIGNFFGEDRKSHIKRGLIPFVLRHQMLESAQLCDITNESSTFALTQQDLELMIASNKIRQFRLPFNPVEFLLVITTDYTDAMGEKLASLPQDSSQSKIGSIPHPSKLSSLSEHLNKSLLKFYPSGIVPLDAVETEIQSFVESWLLEVDKIIVSEKGVEETSSSKLCTDIDSGKGSRCSLPDGSNCQNGGQVVVSPLGKDNETLMGDSSEDRCVYSNGSSGGRQINGNGHCVNGIPTEGAAIVRLQKRPPSNSQGHRNPSETSAKRRRCETEGNCQRNSDGGVEFQRKTALTPGAAKATSELILKRLFACGFVRRPVSRNSEGLLEFTYPHTGAVVKELGLTRNKVMKYFRRFPQTERRMTDFVKSGPLSKSNKVFVSARFVLSDLAGRGNLVVTRNASDVLLKEAK